MAAKKKGYGEKAYLVVTFKGECMDKYIEGNKAAWEEAFENRDPSWGTDITDRMEKEDYPFFNEETKNVLKSEF